MVAVFREPDRRRAFAQDRRQYGRRHRAEHLPVGCRDRHHHAVGGLADLPRPRRAGHVIVALGLPMHTASRGVEDRHGVVRHQRQAARQERRVGIPSGPHRTRQRGRQCHKGRRDGPALPLHANQAPGPYLLRRHIGAEVQDRGPLAGGLLEHAGETAEREGLPTLGVLDQQRLCTHGAAPRDALTDGGPQEFPLPRAMWPEKTCGLPAGAATQQPQGANVAVGAPQVARPDARQPLRDPAAFLGVSSLGHDDIGEHSALRIQEHARLPGEGSRPGTTSCLEALCGRGPMMPVEDCARRARAPPRMTRAPRVPHRGGEPCRVASQGRGHLRCDPIKLVLQGGGRHAHLFFVRLIGRMHRRLDTEDDFTHELHHRGEQQRTRIRVRRCVCAERITPIGVQEALSHATGHDTDGPLLNERGTYAVQQHRCHLQQAASCSL